MHSKLKGRCSNLMKSLICLISIFINSFSYAETEAGPITASYSAKKISEHVYVIHGPEGLPSAENQGFMNNPGFVITGTGVVVIDPGSSIQIGKMVLQKIKQTTDLPVVATFSSHIHGDHWLGNQAIKQTYPEVKMYAHPNLIQQAQDGEGDNWVELMNNLTNGATAGTKPVVPKIPVIDGDSIEIGGINFEIHHRGQAHTSSDIAILIHPDNTLFTGDLVFNSRLGRMDDGNFSGLLQTLDYLISLSPTLVVPGHGKTGNISIIRQNKSFYSTLYQTIEKYFEEGLPDFEIKDIVVERLVEFTGWAGFKEGIGRMVSIGYLEVEQDSF